MRSTFAIIFLLWYSTNSFGQNSTVYNWEDVQSANPDTVYALSFSKMKLETLPQELEKFQNLTYLNLEKNKLRKIPDFIADLDRLKEINLGKNKLDNFPVQFCRMKNIERVILNRNLFELIPECIGGMKSLRYLDVYDCPIRSLPESLTKLKSLEEIDFSGIVLVQHFKMLGTKNYPTLSLFLIHLAIAWIKIC